MAAVYEEVPFEELDYVEDDDMFYYQCPCGDMFEISRVRIHPANRTCRWHSARPDWRRRLPHHLTQAQVERGERIARCPSCSLTIRLIHPDDATPPLAADQPQTTAANRPLAAGDQPQTAGSAAAAGSSAGIPVLHVNAFTRDTFGGNPAAVCLLSAPADESWMQGVAANMNLSATAFVTPTGETQTAGGPGAPAAGETFDLHWFTPKIEVELCEHATLAAAHVLFSLPGGRHSPTLRFSTRSGELRARRLPNHTIELDLAARPPAPLGDAPPSHAAVAAALRLDSSAFELFELPGGALDLLVLLRDEADVRALDPDMRAVARLPHRGLIVTAPADPSADETAEGAVTDGTDGSRTDGMVTDETDGIGVTDVTDGTDAIAGTGRIDFVSRFFGPRAGIDEDPVTGLAHCTLAPFWSARLGGRRVMRAQQLSARGGELEMELTAGGRVLIRGHAGTTMEGRLVGPGPPQPGEG